MINLILNVLAAVLGLLVVAAAVTGLIIPFYLWVVA